LRFDGAGLCVRDELLGGFGRNGVSCYFGWWLRHLLEGWESLLPAACCKILVIAVFAASPKNCGDILLLLTCASSSQKVGVILATFLESADV